jgi:hypothetical protein
VRARGKVPLTSVVWADGGEEQFENKAFSWTGRNSYARLDNQRYRCGACWVDTADVKRRRLFPGMAVWHGRCLRRGGQSDSAVGDVDAGGEDIGLGAGQQLRDYGGRGRRDR